MAQITGFGGVFLRVDDPAALYAWYETNLGIGNGPAGFKFPPARQDAKIAVSFFRRASDYFPPAQPAMLSFRVDDLDAVLDRLTAAGADVDPHREAGDYGKFGWFTDPAGNRVELWQPSS